MPRKDKTGRNKGLRPYEQKQVPPAPPPKSLPTPIIPPRRLPPGQLDTTTDGPERPVIPALPAGMQPPETISQDTLENQAQLLAELARRRAEALSLYRPLQSQDRFHKSSTIVRLLRGSNRAGKTLPAAIECARACTGQDPYGKYRKEDGRCFIIGGDLKKHVGQVLYRKLFRAGAFQMIRDPDTGLWRAWQPWHPYDLEHESDTRPVPPLIPKRFIKSIAWENKKASIPQIITLHNGWELNFFSSLGKPPQGSDVDLVWMDEEVVDPDWVPEMQARIVDRAGFLIWSFTPQAGTEQAYELHEQAEIESISGVPPADRSVEEFEILVDHNAYMTPKKIKRFKRSIRSDDEYEVRIKGQFLVRSLLVFPEWNESLYIDPMPIPDDWWLCLFIDPGRQVAAALFIAVPPPGPFADHVYLYDEVYIHESDARKFAKEVAAKANRRPFGMMMIDNREARKKSAATGRSLKSQYELELRKAGVRTVDGGCSLLTAPDDPKAGRESVRSWLTPDDRGVVKCRPMRGRVPNLDTEMRMYRNKRVKVNGVYTILDEPVKRRDHLVDCLRYGAASDPQYQRPPKRRRTASELVRWLLRKKKKRRRKDPVYNMGPPGE